MKRILSVLLLAVCATIVCAKEPKRPDSYNYQRGVEAINDGNYDEGEKYLLEELNVNPKNGYAYAWLSSVESNRDELGNVITMLNLALKYIPKSDKYYIAWTHSALSRAYINLDDSIQALVYANNAVKAQPNNTEWLKERAYLYLNLEQYDKALEDSKKLIQLEPGKVAGYLLSATVHFEQEQYTTALELYKRANTLAERGYIYSCIAQAENKLQRYEDAADHIIEAFKITALEETAYNLITKENSELLDELLPRVKIQASKNPNSIEWKLYLITIYSTNKQYEQAINVAKEAQTLDNNPYYDYLISSLYDKLGDFDVALQYAKSAHEADTTDQQYLYQMITVHNELNQLDQAKVVADKLTELNPDKSRPFMARANILFEQQKYSESIEDYSTALAINSNYHFARLKRGYAYLLTGDNAKAKKDFERIAQDAHAQVEQAFAYYHLGQHDKARALADSLLKADTIYYYNRYNVACIYSLLGETELAFATLEAELKDGYAYFNHIRRDLDFKNIHGARFDQLIEKYEQLTQQRVNAFKDKTSNSTKEERVVDIPFTAAHGVTKVDCTINNLPLNFIFDTGASDVTISKVEADFMLKNGYLNEQDIVGKKTYQVATGAIAVGTTIVLKEIKFGGLVLNDVRASVVESQNAPLLLGQSVLQRLGKIEIDNVKRVLKITTKQ
jgi:clan AA aspartic protease (TIGR02281 family)